MKCIKKILCILLMFAFSLSIVPQSVLALSVPYPSLNNVTDPKTFTALPGVYEMGDGYAVIWATTFAGMGYIEYTYQGTKYTVYDEKNGIVRTNDTIHVVKVPYEHLAGNSYMVYSKEVTSHRGAITNYGTTISAGPITLKKYDGGTNDFDMLVLTDVHGQLGWARSVAAQFGKDPDMVVFSGDIVNNIDSKESVATMFNIMGTVTGGRYPIVYCRGNHETRGIYSTTLLDYFPTKTGEFYFDFRYGPLWGVVIDTGEDKEDSHEYYGGLANYKEYHQKQEVWLRSLRYDTSATFRFGIYHIPYISSLSNGIDLSDSVKHLGLQFAVSGHEHTYSVVSGSSAGVYHSNYISGGYDVNVGTFVTLDNNAKKAYITSKTSSGASTGYNNYGVSLTSSIGSVPSAGTEPAYGTNAKFTPSGSPKGSISISVEPTVFETGGDYYNVVWETQTNSSSAKGMTGYIEYTYNGKTYQLFDEVGGYRRSYSSIHTVKVPKAHLNNNKYKVGSYIVEFSYTNPSAQVGRYYSRGDYVVSKDYWFEDRRDDSAVNVVVCPDVVSSPATKNLAAAQQSASALGTSPTLFVFNGDTTLSAVNDSADIRNVFAVTSTISGGIHPVVFSRGNSECRGLYATEIIKYIPTATGEFYFDFTYGDYHFVNLDTTEDSADGNFSGRVTLSAVRQRENTWLNSISGGKIVAISHMPLSTIKNAFGYDWETLLKGKGAVLSINGHSTSFSLKETVNSNSIYAVTAGGGYWTGSEAIHTSSSIILSDNYAYIKAAKYQSGGITYLENKSVSLSNGTTMSFASQQPTKSNGVYVLTTPAHIRWIADNCTSANSFAGETFIMKNDIDLMLVPIAPIGGNDAVNDDNNSTSKAFAGTFDGNRYKIKNLNLSTGHNGVGFFGMLRNGTVKNLTIDGGYISGGWFTGGIAGAAFGSTIEDCYTDATVHSVGGSKVGGIVGFLSKGSTVKRCANLGAVTIRNSQGNVGGITGQIGGSDNKIYSTYNRGVIASHGTSSFAGGIMGYASSTAGCEIKDCYNASAVLGAGSKGTILGSCSGSSKVTISNTYYATGFGGASKGANGTDSWSTSSGSGTLKSRSQSEMKSSSMASTLNSTDYTYSASLNGGYPIHKNSLLTPGSSSVTPPITPTVPQKITLKSGSGLTISGGTLYGVAEKTTVSQLRAKISNTSGITINSVGTGSVITLTVDGTVTDSVTILVMGDLDGDGVISTTDYLRVKGAFLGSVSMSGIYKAAADIDGNNIIDSTDYARVKGQFLGTYNIYA